MRERKRLLTRLTAAALTALCAAALAASAEEETPKSPFAKPGDGAADRPDAVQGRFVLSDGTAHEGRIYLTRDKRLEVFNTASQEWLKLKLSEISSISFAIESETEEKEWRWKEGGSDVKVFTGRTYVDRRYSVTVKLAAGGTVSGHVRGTVIYVEPPGKEPVRFFLRKDERGDWNRKPAEIIYVKEILLGDAAKAPAPAAGGDGGR